jgi:hypothetical protein
MRRGVLTLTTTLRVVCDLAEVVVPSCFKSTCYSVDWRCGIKVLFVYSLNQKSVTPVFDRVTSQALTFGGLTGFL